MNVSLRFKIILTSTLAVLLCLGISLFGSWRLQQGMNKYKYIVDVNFQNVKQLKEMETDAIMVEAAANFLIGSNTTVADAKKAQKSIESAEQRFSEAAKIYEGFPFAEGEEAAWKQFQENFWKVYVGYAKKIVDLSGTGRADDRASRDQLAATNWAKVVEVRESAFDKLVSFQDNEVKLRSGDASSDANRLSWLIPVLLVAAGVLSIVLSVFLGVSVAKGLMHVANTIVESTSQVAAASTQIASSSAQLSQATTEQAASLEETAASLEQISAMISKASDSAQSTASSSTESQDKAQEGRAAVEMMLGSMEEISQSNDAIMAQINASNQQMAEIVSVIQDIGNKTKVINEIVFQTKLLSFNASVEAARAGEHGKGFAVVAEEVGNLAQMSGNAAKEISDMLNGSISRVETIVNETKRKVASLADTGKQKVDLGVSVARQCAEVLNEIVQNVSKVSNLAQDISQATKEQAQGVGEINKAMGQLDTVTQQNAGTSEEAARAAEQLSAQAEFLKQAVDELVFAVQGGAPTSPAQQAQVVSLSEFKNKSHRRKAS